MSPPISNEELQELAALYALGALTQHEARAIENQLADCPNGLAEEVSAFESVTAWLGFAAPEQPPPAASRQTLLARIAEQPQPEAATEFSLPMSLFSPPAQLFSLRAEEGEWQEIGPGMTTKTLFVDSSRGLITSLVRMSAGSSLPPHKHRGEEQFYVLEGDCIVHGTRLGPGDFHRAAPGSIHQSTFTVSGTTFLLIAPADYEFLQSV